MEDILQQGGQIALTALGSLAALFLLTKLSGNKQVSQMNLFDYVMGITIGSIAAEMASELESPLRPLWAMVVYGLAAWGIALLTNKSIRVRRFITGKPLILMDSGVIYRKNLRRGAGCGRRLRRLQSAMGMVQRPSGRAATIKSAGYCVSYAISC